MMPDLDDWEARCKRCGECCFEKWIDGDGTIYPTGVACRFLDIVTRECKVYHKRLEVDESCILLTPETVAALRWLPPTCGYRESPEEMGRRSRKKRNRR